ncbi:MAG: HAMP domain-containing histidine kinase [Chloroflexi bacterium]|nr:HAMP domain-containing histidine kinase [Chloroflexota bacterium]
MSIRLRLTLWYGALLACGLVGFGALLYITLNTTLEAEADRELAANAREIIGTSVVNYGYLPNTFWTTFDVNVFASPNVFVQVSSLQGEVQTRSANLDREVLPVTDRTLQAARQKQSLYQNMWVEGRELRVYSAPLVLEDGRVVGVLQLARPVMADEPALQQLRFLLVIMGVVSLLVAVTLGWFLARAALRPIDRLAQVVQEIGDTQDFERRVEYAGPRDEVGRLAKTFNQMLERLHSAYEHLNAALAAQRRFVADASHELRTPLTSIRGNIGFLRRVVDMDPRDRDAALADVASEVERMSRLVSDLLTLARADAGQHLIKQSVEIAPLVRDVARHARFLTEEVHVVLSTVEDVRVQGDPDALKQLLLILTDNAVKYTPPDGSVTLTARRVGAAVWLDVADTGPGIPPDEQARIFERFYRADRARSGDGAGLGLAIARWIVEEHGGRVAVESRPGNGSVFRVELPLELDAPVNPSTAVPASSII